MSSQASSWVLGLMFSSVSWSKKCILISLSVGQLMKSLDILKFTLSNYNLIAHQNLFLFTMKKHKIKDELIIIEEVQSRTEPLYNFRGRSEWENEDHFERDHNPEQKTSHNDDLDANSYEDIMNQQKMYRRINQQERNKQFSQSYHYSHSINLSSKPNTSTIPSLKTSNVSKNNYSSYYELTLKLENAFNKITTSRKTLSKSTSHINDIWKRTQLSLQKRQRQMQKKVEQKQREIFKQYRDRPSIDKNSAKITKSNGYQPIHLRFQKVIQQKKFKTEYQREVKHKQKIQQQQQILQIQNKYNKQPRTTRTYTQYYTQMVRWKEKADKRTQHRAEAETKKEIEGATFKPNINNKSKTMMLQQFRLPIDQRGLLKKKISHDSSFTYNTSSRRVAK